MQGKLDFPELINESIFKIFFLYVFLLSQLEETEMDKPIDIKKNRLPEECY